LTQYQAGLTNQLTVLNADINALSADQSVVDLKMNRRDQQIALAAALGGGYTDTSDSSSSQSVATR
jgi:outer membrane protein TolC